MNSRLVIAAVFFVSITKSFGALAAEDTYHVSRRDGILLIWEGIHRKAEETREKPFDDVHEGDLGFFEITFAKARGIIGAKESFRPDDPLDFDTAVLWLLRTRNVDDLDRLQPENLRSLLRKFPFERTLNLSRNGAKTHPEKILSSDELAILMNILDGFLRQQLHEASLYSEKFQGKGTAFGESFDMNTLTAAHRTFPWNTLVRVTNVSNGKSVIVRINDRGPFVAGRDMDLSLAAFVSIADRSLGKIQARFERLGDARLVGAQFLCPTGKALQRREKRTKLRGVAEMQCLPNKDHQ